MNEYALSPICTNSGRMRIREKEGRGRETNSYRGERQKNKPVSKQASKQTNTYRKEKEEKWKGTKEKEIEDRWIYSERERER